MFDFVPDSIKLNSDLAPPYKTKLEQQKELIDHVFRFMGNEVVLNEIIQQGNPITRNHLKNVITKDQNNIHKAIWFLGQEHLKPSSKIYLREVLRNYKIPQLIKESDKPYLPQFLYDIYYVSRNEAALERLIEIAETRDSEARNFLFDLAKKDLSVKNIVSKNPKLSALNLKIAFSSDYYSLHSGFSFGGGRSRDGDSGFRNTLVPIGIDIYPQKYGLNDDLTLPPSITADLETRLGTGPLNRFAGGARVGAGYSWVGLYFRGGFHESGKGYVGGELEVNLGIIPTGLFWGFVGRHAVFPALVVGYEKLVGIHPTERAPSDFIYGGIQIFINWFPVTQWGN